MPCYRVAMPNGGFALVKGKLGPHCSCGGVTTRLCDYPVGKGKTCDRKLCERCGHHVGPDKDLCLEHYKMRGLPITGIWLDEMAQADLFGDVNA